MWQKTILYILKHFIALHHYFFESDFEWLTTDAHKQKMLIKKENLVNQGIGAIHLDI
jgi:hypothetical protein